MSRKSLWPCKECGCPHPQHLNICSRWRPVPNKITPKVQVKKREPVVESWNVDPNTYTKAELVERFQAQKETIRSYREAIDNPLPSGMQIVQDANLDEGVVVMINQARYTRENNRFKKILDEVEERVTKLVAARHDYPMWPIASGPMDAFDEEYHTPLRHSYYEGTLFLVRILRVLRTMG